MKYVIKLHYGTCRTGTIRIFRPVSACFDSDYSSLIQYVSFASPLVIQRCFSWRTEIGSNILAVQTINRIHYVLVSVPQRGL